MNKMPTEKFTINQKFSMSVERSQRVLECAEAFGLGLEDKDFVVYENLNLELFPDDVVYITGQSGSGKSLLLKELSRQLSERGKKVQKINDVQFEDKPLIDQVGKSTDDAIRILSMAGLNDAYLFVRKPQELSDGQRYRFALAKLMESDAQVWVADEFGAVLDRTTAKAVAFSMQKFSRKVGAMLIVATTHKDLRKELAPDVYVDKEYKSKLKVEIAHESGTTEESQREKASNSKGVNKSASGHSANLRNGSSVILRPKRNDKTDGQKGNSRKIRS